MGALLLADTITQSLAKATQKVPMLEITLVQKTNMDNHPPTEYLKTKCRSGIRAVVFAASQGMSRLGLSA